MLKNSALFTENGEGALLSDGAKICRCCENRSGDSTYDVSSTEKEGQTYPRQTVQMGEEFRESKKSVDVMFGSLLRYLATDDDDVCYL